MLIGHGCALWSEGVAVIGLSSYKCSLYTSRLNGIGSQITSLYMLQRTHDRFKPAIIIGTRLRSAATDTLGLFAQWV